MIHRPRNQVVEMEVRPFNTTPGDPLGEFLPPVAMTLCSTGLDVLVQKEEMLPSRSHNNDSIELEIKTAT